MKTKILGFFLLCISISTWANTESLVTIEEDTPKYYLKLEYPQNFSPAINQAIKTYFAEHQRSFMHTLKHGVKLPGNVPGKDSLVMISKVVYQNNTALSLLFDFSNFSRGAAHPRNSVETWNFLNGERVELAALFLPDSNYLSLLSKYCSEQILKKNISDKKWIMEGTEPKEDNYSNWYFTKNGITIIFDTYQVAAYVFGPQTIEIPRSELQAILKKEAATAIWGNND